MKAVPVSIRDEGPADVAAVREVNRRAFGHGPKLLAEALERIAGGTQETR